MNKFVKDLTKDANGIKLQRAENLGSGAAAEQADLIRDLEREKRELQKRLLDLTDLSPETTIDLKPGKDFDAKGWVRQIQDLKIGILNIDIQLEVANETNKEWFLDVQPAE